MQTPPETTPEWKWQPIGTFPDQAELMYGDPDVTYTVDLSDGCQYVVHCDGAGDPDWWFRLPPLPEEEINDA